MVYRIFVEKKPELAHEARALKEDIRSLLMIESVTDVRVLNRYDVEGISEELFSKSRSTVFSEPQLDTVTETLETKAGDTVFAVEFLPGQFNQRADSASQCVQLLSQGDRPLVATAKVYVLSGTISDAELAQIKKHVINPVEAREASLAEKETLAEEYPVPADVAVLTGFTALDRDGLVAFVKQYGLAMDVDDAAFCQAYFQKEGRDPTIAEIRMIDTYWSDHCRHTTFLTTIDSVKFENPAAAEAWDRYLDARKSLGRTKPINFMDIATIGAKVLKKEGKLTKLDESEEINACTVKITVNHDGKDEDWLLLFKNETHNHPTEIEPFGGAATCIGGAIRDPLSGRSYVYAAMRVTGAADPTVPVSETLAGKLPQRKIVTTAAAGYSSYGNQIGLATGMVDEIYHPGYAAKRMEIGAVIAAAPAENVRRECPEAGDLVILLGGRTGRDGCGGATGSSKSHTEASLTSCGAEVQKGNAPEERKLQRLFRNKEASRLIKRCNDFGAGGVSVAIGELADGLTIQLDAVPKKYEGLDGTELAISESQERMAVVVAASDAKAFCELAAEENLEATIVAEVTDKARLTMFWRGDKIVDISREFLNSNGAEKHITVETAAPVSLSAPAVSDFADGYKSLARDLNVCSKRGLSETFDSTIGAGTVLMPFGGKYQRTPIQAMVHKVSVEHGDTDTCSFMSWGYNPNVMTADPYRGAYLAVVESVSKLIAAGASREDVYLTFQEYFEKPGRDPKRWGKPLAALLGSLDAQLDLGIASIGGKDSMSGSFEKLDVPPTLVSFAVTTGKVGEVVSGDFKAANHRVAVFAPEYNENGIPKAESQLKLYDEITALMREGKILAAYTPAYGGIAEAVMKMAMGNGLGFAYSTDWTLSELFSHAYGAFVCEMADGCGEGRTLGTTAAEAAFTYGDKAVTAAEIETAYETKLEKIYACNIPTEGKKIPAYEYRAESRVAPAVKIAKPRVLIPVFPGTNCEYDSAKAVEAAGAEAKLFVIRNLTPDDVARSAAAFAEEIEKSQVIFVPGGFSGGDEPDGTGKFITAFFRGEAVRHAVGDLLDRRDGLMCGICNGFQALIKLGLVPFGKIIDTDADCPTLTFNTISRHQSKLVRTRIASNKSPWLALTNVGDVYTVPISHGEGRFLASDKVIADLAANGQIATQYVDLAGNPTDDVQYNPNDSMMAIEGITSPDGRVFGKMGHSERIGTGLYQNVPGQFDIRMFEAAVKYFK